jgi:hypothetical protein
VELQKDERRKRNQRKKLIRNKDIKKGYERKPSRLGISETNIVNSDTFIVPSKLRGSVP